MFALNHLMSAGNSISMAENKISTNEMPIDEYSLKVLMSFKIVHGSLYFISPWRGPIFG